MVAAYGKKSPVTESDSELLASRWFLTPLCPNRPMISASGCLLDDDDYLIDPSSHHREPKGPPLLCFRATCRWFAPKLALDCTGIDCWLGHVWAHAIYQQQKLVPTLSTNDMNMAHSLHPLNFWVPAFLLWSSKPWPRISKVRRTSRF